jgi:hypothetical protein
MPPLSNPSQEYLSSLPSWNRAVLTWLLSLKVNDHLLTAYSYHKLRLDTMDKSIRENPAPAQPAQSCSLNLREAASRCPGILPGHGPPLGLMGLAHMLLFLCSFVVSP